MCGPPWRAHCISRKTADTGKDGRIRVKRKSGEDWIHLAQDTDP
jgi:hypothetical protein